jgi:hypothetical protein
LTGWDVILFACLAVIVGCLAQGAFASLLILLGGANGSFLEVCLSCSVDDGIPLLLRLDAWPRCLS